MDATWLKYLPRYISIRLSGRSALQEAFSNSSWLALDRMLRIGIGAVITVWLARYLGPDRYGLLSYAIGFATLFSALASLGLKSIVVRDLVRLPERNSSILSSALILRLLGSTCAFILALGAVWLMRPDDRLSQWLVGIVAAAMIFQSSEVIELWFQSRLRSRYAVFCKGAVFLTISVIKVWLILVQADLIAFAWVFLAEFVITATLLMLVFRGTGNALRIQARFIQQAKRLLGGGWPLMLSNMAVVFYMRLDIVMLREIKGESAAGIYAAATVISEAGYFLPTVIVASVFPIIIKYREKDLSSYLISLRKLYFVLFWLAIAVVLPLSLLAGRIIRVLYGIEFQDAAPVLAIHLWASVPMFLCVAIEHYLLAESMQKIVFIQSAIGAGVNITLNALLIPLHGTTGAALATVFSYIFMLTTLMFFKKTRQHCSLLINAIGLKNKSNIFW